MNNFKLKKWSLVSMVLLLALGLGGCIGGPEDDIRDKLAKIRSTKKSSPSEIPKFRVFKPHAFSAKDFRSPFEVADKDLADFVNTEDSADLGPSLKVYSGPRPDSDRVKEELEKFPIDTFKMVGAVRMGNVDWALLSHVDGSLYRVKAENYIGQNHGQIVEITSNQVSIRELVADGFGRWRHRDAFINRIVKEEK